MLNSDREQNRPPDEVAKETGLRFELYCKPLFERLQADYTRLFDLLEELKTSLLGIQNVAKQASKIIDGNGQPPIGIRFERIETRLTNIEDNRKLTGAASKILTDVITYLILGIIAFILASLGFYIKHQFTGG